MEWAGAAAASGVRLFGKGEHSEWRGISGQSSELADKLSSLFLALGSLLDFRLSVSLRIHGEPPDVGVFV
jgi:hypothetical protein